MERDARQLAGVLVSAAAAVKAINSALIEGRHFQPAIDEVDTQSTALFKCETHPTAAVPSGVREAAVTLAHDLQAANKALKARLLAAGQRPARDDAALPDAAVGLAKLAMSLVFVFKIVSGGGDTDLVFRVMCAGQLCVDAGSLACTLPYASAVCKRVHSTLLPEMVRRLDSMRALYQGYEHSLAVLRATTFRPEAILTALRRLLPEQGPPGNDGEVECIISILERVFREDSCYEAERDAIGSDSRLQAGIVGSLEETIKHFVSGADPHARTAYVRACMAINLLASTELELGARERAAINPAGRVRTLTACFDLILEGPAPGLEVEVEVEAMQRAALSFWGAAVLEACGSDCSGRPPLVAEFLGCLQRAAAAAAFLLQKHGADARLWDGALNSLSLLMNRIPDLYLSSGIDVTPVLEAQGSTNATRHALLLSFLPALESITRVAALLPVRLQPGLPFDERGDPWDLLEGYKAALTLMDSCGEWCLRTDDGVLSQAATTAAAGVVESVAKLALVTAGRAAGPRRVVVMGPPNLQRELLGQLAESCLDLTSLLGPLVIKGQGAVNNATIKRWQAVSLAVSSTVVALAGSESQALPSDFFLPVSFKQVPLSLLPWPGIRDVLPSVPAGRPAVHQALVDLSERDLDLDEQRATTTTLNNLGTLMQPSQPGRRETALVLAQLGTLSQLASWGEQQCGKSPSDDCLEGLGRVQLLAKWGVQGSAVEVQAAYKLIVEGPIDLSSAAYWRRLREEVTEPLAAALEAKAAAAAQDPAQVAVDVAEALATRTCAYVGCTTVVGASEAAAPRGKRCSACRLVRYCGVACQKADWPAHKAACRELRRRSACGS